MRFGIGIGDIAGRPATVDEIVAEARAAAAAGFPSMWMAQVFGYDALTLLAVVGREVDGIELGTFVVPTFPRHPMVLAAQALTVQAATGGRLTLGIGLSHQLVVENMFGLSFDKPARHMREYLSALRPLLRGEQVSVEATGWKAVGQIRVPDSSPPSVLLAALAPRMLQLAGRVADGTLTWMTGPRTLANHIVPSITKAAADAGRPPPRIVCGLPICVTGDVDHARQRAAERFTVYGHLPSYRAMIDKEGAAGPADVAIVGDEAAVTAHLQSIADAGATDFVAAPFGSADERQHTIDLLASLGLATSP
jgi:F420-dependent oxidoreductase-like protein